MILNVDRVDHIYIVCGFTDGRKNIDSLARLVSDYYRKDPFSNNLFVFCSRQRNILKALHWDENGFELYTKKVMEDKFKWPNDESELKNITQKQLYLLLQGFTIEGFKNIEKKIF